MKLICVLTLVTVLRLDCMTIRTENDELFTLQPGQVLIRRHEHKESPSEYYVCSSTTFISEMNRCCLAKEVFSKHAKTLLCRNDVVFCYNERTHLLEAFEQPTILISLLVRLIACEWTATPLKKTGSTALFKKNKDV